MKEQTWTRREYENWDEAFRGLDPLLRNQSMRVAAYTEKLFIQACKSSYGLDTASGSKHMKIKFTEVAYNCGAYHQIGKALVPPEYQNWQSDFTSEEQELYKKYTTDGRVLVANLQERAHKLRLKGKGKDEKEAPTINIPSMMIREACQQHMERWDGSGYPDGRKGDEISPIAQIVGLSKMFDAVVSETKSETPFEDAVSVIVAQADKAFSPELIKVFHACKDSFRTIFKKYEHYTMALPKTIHLLEKRKDRSMGLSYRPMVNGLEGKINAYEAIPWFGGIEDRPSETDNVEIIEPQLRRLDLISSITTYFLYEVTDTLLRIENCKLETIDAIVLEMIPSFYMDDPDTSRFETLFEHQPIDRSRLILTVPAFVVVNANEAVETTLKSCIEKGAQLMVDAWEPEKLPVERLQAIGIQYVRLHPDQYLKKESADILSALPAAGITAYAKDADTEDAVRWLVACGVKHFVGASTGHPVDEDELIRDALLRERDNG